MLTLPNCLSGLRLLLVPVLLALAWANLPKVFLTVLFFAMFTDMADGYFARKLNQTSEFGAKLDSWADFATYPALPLCAWWLRPDFIREEKLLLVVSVFFYLAAIAFGFLKFRRLNAYHTWSGKAAAIVLGAAALAIFAGAPGWVFRIATPVIIFSALEEIAITVVLSARRADVPSLLHAIRIQQARQKASEVLESRL